MTFISLTGFITQALGFKDINGESIQRVLGCRFIGSCILQILGIWLVILDVLRFLFLRTFLIDVPIPTSYVLVPTPLAQLICTLASRSLTVTLVYAC